MDVLAKKTGEEYIKEPFDGLHNYVDKIIRGYLFKLEKVPVKIYPPLYYYGYNKGHRKTDGNGEDDG